MKGFQQHRRKEGLEGWLAGRWRVDEKDQKFGGNVEEDEDMNVLWKKKTTTFIVVCFGRRRQ
jgi:hypothetical protein